MKNFFSICVIFLIYPATVFAAIPFVTDDAAIANRNQLLIETFTETWKLSKKNDSEETRMFGQYLGVAYGAAKNLEVTIGSLAGYDTKLKSAAYMNPVLQMKTIAFSPKKPEIPTIAFSAAYVNNNGRGQYYDSATSYYLMGIATSKFFDDDLIIHINLGPKASYNIDGQKSYHRMHLGVALDTAFFRKDVRLFAESFNGAPNSPRDSHGYFHSYQTGFKFIAPDNWGFHILYGSQPTFNGYDQNNAMTYRRTEWIQFGIRKAIDDFF
ncbi:MAG: hypothetical protein V4612_04295 [Pseudomonadota bacterium]